MNVPYVVIPLFTLIVAVGGSMLTGAGMDWYKTISLPSFTPPGWIIGAVWTVIFILSTISAMIVWNQALRNQAFLRIIALFVINAVLNVLWSYLFFIQHYLLVAVFESALLCTTVVFLIILIWPLSRVAALLLIPYAGWVTFATYLSYWIWNLNK